MVDVEIKQGLVVSKALKEGANGEYAEFEIKGATDKFPKKIRWFFNPDEEWDVLYRSIKKEGYVDVVFSETQKQGANGPITYRNLIKIQLAEAPVNQPSAQTHATGQNSGYWGSTQQLKDQEKISRQWALNCAVEILKLNVQTRPTLEEIKAGDLLIAAQTLADECLKYAKNEVRRDE